jgi:hypothetical protein
MSKSTVTKIPFDRLGNQMHYPENGYRPAPNGRYESVPPDWRPNYEFEDVLRFVEYRRGRSAAYFVFQTSNGTEVTMFLKDFTDMLHRVNIYGGCVQKARYTFCKRGANYGLKHVG